MSGNGLYGYTANANVAVGNTTGLYIGGGNVVVLTNAQQLYNLLANSSSIGFYLTNNNLNVSSATLPTGVTSGTYGSTSLIPVVTVGTDGRVTSVSTVTIPTQTGTYSNTNVAAYLTGTVTVGNLITSAGVYWSNGAPYSSGSGSIYGNANVAAYLPTYTGTLDLSSTIIAINANVAGANAAQTTANTIQSNQINALTSGQTAANVSIATLQANVGSFYTYANATYSTQANAGSLQNQITGANAAIVTANTAMKAYVDAANTVQSNQIQTISANLGAFETYANANFITTATDYGNANVAVYLASNAALTITTTANIKTIANVISPNYLYPNGVSILTGIGGTYSNTNVAAYLTTATIATTGNITGANLITAGNVYGAYVIGNGALLTNLPVQAGTYSNTNVAAYLTTATIATTGNITGANLTTAGNVTASYVKGDGSLLTNLPVQAGTYSNTNVAAYLTTATIATTGNITGANLTTAGNVTASYIKGNGSLLTNLPSSTVTLTGNVTGSGQTGTNINTLIAASGVTPGTYGADNAVPVITVAADGRITTLTTTPIGSGGGAYGNANVQAYLPTYTGAMPNLTSVNTSANITANTGGYFIGDGSKLTNLPAQASTYGNANVAAYLPTFAGDIGNADTPASTGYFNTVNATTLSGALSGSQTGITAIAGYIESGGVVEIQDTSQVYIHAPIMVLGDTSYTQTVGINGHLNIVGNTTTEPYAGNAIVVNNGNVQVNPGYYYLGDGSQLTNLPTQAGTYSNANVGAYLSSNTVSTIFATGNITTVAGVNTNTLNATGNVTAAYVKGNGSLLTNLPTQPGTYTNSNVTNLLSGGTYTGDVIATTGVVNAAAINSSGALTAGSYVQANNGLYSINTFSGTYSDGIVVDYVTGNGRISVGTADNLTFYTGGVAATQTLQLASNGAAIAGNLITTNGVFWSNGTAYSTGGGSSGVTSITAGTGITANAATGAISITNAGVTAIVAGSGITANASTGVVSISSTGGGTTFNGNLLGNTLVDTTNNRVTINASPYSDPGIQPPLWQNMKNNPPVYIGGVLQAPTYPNLNNLVSNDSYLMLTTSNVGVQSSYQTTNTRFTSGILNYQSVWPVTANTMTNNDRLRNTTSILDLNMAGKSWGTTASSTFNVAVGVQQNFLNLYGNGYVTSGSGVGSVIYITPIGTALGTGLSANVTYLTGVTGTIQHQTTYGSTNTANITTARGYLAQVSIGSNSVAVTNAIGFHTPSGWVTQPNATGGQNITNRYAILNEDQYSTIQTNGNITQLNTPGIPTLFTSANLKLGGYNSPQKTFSNPASGNINLGTSNYNSYQQIQFNGGNLGVACQSTGYDTVYDFFIQQDSTGGRTLTWYASNGTPQPPSGYLNPLPNAVTYARVALQDSGTPSISYGTPSAVAMTAAQANSYPGVVGNFIAISDNGGKLAYWDTTNSRWSYIQTGLAV